ncbi:hypothetical protein JTE90_010474 [Oedothorax gibbosus]|uniref:Uncharacterized protein n=1 Tax=Oedothorax gibbosus TaxID=931172 RepID=A0AAV6W5E2_9ARAC|nr:hypothetical protein JTE90_010474 [Oedothorax gibbosus]
MEHMVKLILTLAYGYLTFHMDRFIINGIKQLYVLKPYHSNSMDELARDLTTALDEPTDRRIDGKVRRSKSWKCRSRSKGSLLGSSLPKSSTKSEDSESSIDNWVQRQMDFSTNGSYQHTDSDDLMSKAHKHGFHLNKWRQCTPNMAESDSVNENLLPSREHRRKRKFKRMAIDPPSAAEQNFAALPGIASFTPKNKRPRSLKAHKISKILAKSPKFSKRLAVSQLSAEMENICKDFKNAATSSGKRKRCAHERSTECSGCDCKEFIANKGNSPGCGLASTCRHMKYVNSKAHEISSSGLSSSDSDYEVQNEESREADDEQSDFFQESGPTCGIPSTSPWWEESPFEPNEKQMLDPNFPNFFQLSESAKSIYSTQMDKFKNERQIRSGRRRLEKELSSISSNPNELLPYMPSRNEKVCHSLIADSCFTKTPSPNEKKKWKGMPNSPGFRFGYGESTGCISESNPGLQSVKKLGFKTSAASQPFGNSALAITNAEKQGFNFSKGKAGNVVQSQFISINPFQSSSPPSPSPKTVLIKKDSPSEREKKF